MKCKAFASQLEAHVGQSPVRGGEAIKTDRKALNNLISCVKNIFGRKATPATNAATSAEPPYRHIGHKRSQTESCTRRHREISRRQLRHSDRKTALQRLHQRCQSYFRRCDLCRVARNTHNAEWSRPSPRQRVAARRNLINQRCKMARL